MFGFYVSTIKEVQEVCLFSYTVCGSLCHNPGNEVPPAQQLLDLTFTGSNGTEDFLLPQKTVMTHSSNAINFS